MSTLGEMGRRPVVTALKTDKLLEAARRMRDEHVGALVVVEPQNGVSVPTGMITDRDMVVVVLATATEYLERLQVGDVLARPIVTARDTDDPREALQRMVDQGIRRLPVVDGDGALVGLVSLDDFIEDLAERLAFVAQAVIKEQLLERDRRRPAA